MLHRALLYVRNGIEALSLRLRMMNLPPLATHMLCIVLGTLLFQPVQGPPEGDLIYWAWKGEAIEPGVHRRYQVVWRSDKAICALGTRSYPVWQSAQKKAFLILPKSKESLEFLQMLQMKKAKELFLKEGDLALCQRAQGVVRYD
jgi:hypothetical protein